MKRGTIACAVVILLCGGESRVHAQDVASSFEQLRVLVRPGDKITVVDAGGREAAGRIGTVTADSLILLTEGGPRKLGEADVATIRQRRPDSLKNGAIIGAAAGAAYGLVGLALSLAMDDGGGLNPAGVATGLIIVTGMGAAAGVGIDALITRRQVIYQKRPGGSRASISPLFRDGRRGAVVSIRF